MTDGVATQNAVRRRRQRRRQVERQQENQDTGQNPFDTRFSFPEASPVVSEEGRQSIVTMIDNGLSGSAFLSGAYIGGCNPDAIQTIEHHLTTYVDTRLDNQLRGQYFRIKRAISFGLSNGAGQRCSWQEVRDSVPWCRSLDSRVDSAIKLYWSIQTVLEFRENGVPKEVQSLLIDQVSESEISGDEWELAGTVE